MESYPRRRLRWSGRWKGKDMVRVQCIWRFRYGPPTYLKGLHRTVCIILSYLTYASICAIQPRPIHALILTAPGQIHTRMLMPTLHFISLTFFFLILDPDHIPWFCPSWISRWATYSKGGFKEGVSLTVDDELNRWQKYSYGCNEWVFDSSIGPFYPFPFQPLLSMITLLITHSSLDCSSTLSHNGGAEVLSIAKSTSSYGPELHCTTRSRCWLVCVYFVLSIWIPV